MNDLITNKEQFNNLYAFAERISNSNILPESYAKKPQNIVIALQLGSYLGLNPMTSLYEIIVVNGRPTISSKLAWALVKNHPQYAGSEIVSTDKICKITLKRKIKDDLIESETVEFKIEEAEKAGLLKKDNWKFYPKDMLRARVISRACSIMFPDLILGTGIKEVEEDSIIIPEKKTQNEIMEESVNNFNNNYENEDYVEPEVVEEGPVFVEEVKEEKEFVFTDEQKGFLKPNQIKFIEDRYKELRKKCYIDKMSLELFEKPYEEFNLSDFQCFGYLLKDLYNANKISDDTMKKIEELKAKVGDVE